MPSDCTGECYATESRENNFVALRHAAAGRFAHTLYAEFHNGQLDDAPIDFRAPPRHVELFDAAADPLFLDNRHGRTDAVELEALKGKLHAWMACAGSACP